MSSNDHTTDDAPARAELGGLLQRQEVAIERIAGALDDPQSTDELAEALRDSDLHDFVAQLFHRVKRLEEQLATEVRTRRVVVVDAEGFERVELSTLPSSGSVTVHGNPGGEEGDERYARLLVEDQGGAGPTAFTGLYLISRGREGASLEVLDDIEGAAVPSLGMTVWKQGDGRVVKSHEGYFTESVIHLSGGVVLGRPEA